MKKNTLTLLLLFAVIISQAQFYNEKTLYKIIYQYSHSHDSLNPKEQRVQDMALYIGSNTSSFISRNNELNDSVQNLVFQKANNNGTYAIRYIATFGPTDLIFINHRSKDLTKAVKHKGTYYIISENYNSIAWTLLPEKKKILNITCQAAAGYYAGRWYKVWFAPKLIGSFGPWKLFGLPGLILEATDSKNHVSFKATAFMNPGEVKAITLPSNSIGTNQEKFDKMVTAKKNTPEQNKDITASATLTSPAGYKPKEHIFNNPLELKKQ